MRHLSPAHAEPHPPVVDRVRSPAPLTPRRSSWGVAGLLTLLLTAGGVFLLRHFPFTRETITSALQQQFPGPIQMQKFQRVYFPHPGCLIEGLTATGSSSDPTHHPTLTVQRVTISGSYSSLFRHAKHLRLQGTGLHLYLPPHNHLRGAAASSGKDTPSTIIVDDLELEHSVLELGRNAGAPLRFGIHHLSAGPLAPAQALSYRVSMAVPLPRGEVQTDGRFGPWQGRSLADVPLAGSYQLAHADLGTFTALHGLLSSTGKYEGTIGTLAVAGSIHSPEFTLRSSGHPINLGGQFRAEVTGPTGDVLLRDTAFSWNRTTLRAVGAITGRAQQPGKTVAVTLSVLRGRIEDLMRLTTPTPPTLDGPVTLEAKAVLPPGDAKFLQRVQFTADFGIGPAAFTRPGVQQSVDKLSERARDQKDTDLRHVESELRGHVALREGVAHFTNTTFQVPAARAQLSGACNMITKQIDITGQLRMTATLSEASTGLKSTLLRLVDPFFKDKKHHAGAMIPVKISGPFAHPQVGLNLLHK